MGICNTDDITATVCILWCFCGIVKNSLFYRLVLIKILLSCSEIVNIVKKYFFCTDNENKCNFTLASLEKLWCDILPSVIFFLHCIISLYHFGTKERNLYRGQFFSELHLNRIVLMLKMKYFEGIFVSV